MRFNEAGKVKKMQEKLAKAVESALTDMMVIAQNHFTDNFKKQGFDDAGVQPWKPRQRTERSRGGARGILIGKGTGTLRKSIAKRKTGRYTGLIFIQGNANKYAKVHNDGLRAGRGKGFTMPKRQFIGDSRNMFRKIDTKVKQRITGAFK